MKYGVIVAEDELLLQKNLIKKIDESPTDFQVVGAAQTGVQALELIEKEVPFLLVTDIRMPVMDGLELIQRAREINPDLDAIIVSGYSEFEYAQTAIHLQVREYLLKPVERKKLEETLLSLQHDYEIKKGSIIFFVGLTLPRYRFSKPYAILDMNLRQCVGYLPRRRWTKEQL